MLGSYSFKWNKNPQQFVSGCFCSNQSVRFCFSPSPNCVYSPSEPINQVLDKGRSYRGLNFFAERDLQVLETISRGEYMTFGMQGKDIRQHLENISPSAMTRIFKRLRIHGIIERVQGTYKYFATAYGKEIIAAGLTIRNLMLIPALA